MDIKQVHMAFNLASKLPALHLLPDHFNLIVKPVARHYMGFFVRFKF